MPEKSSFFEKLYPFRWQLLFLLLGIILVSGGIFINKADLLNTPNVEIIEDDNDDPITNNSKVFVEVSGSVVTPGVYSLDHTARVEDALSAAGGLTEEADTSWTQKYLNRAAPLQGGQKIYIPSVNDQSGQPTASNNQGGSEGSVQGEQSPSGMININTASQSQLESLWGIGPVTAQKIIEQRIYSSVDELLAKGIVNKNVLERNKDKLTVY